MLNNIIYAYDCGNGIEEKDGLTLTRDKSGNPLTWGATDETYTKLYSYDENSRLASANLPGNAQVNYGYDWVGNRLITGSYSYNAADQLTGEGGRTYSYDDNGNLTSISGTGGKTFTYSANNLVNTIVGGSNTSTMTWDSSENRVKLVTSGAATYGYVYNPLAGIPAVIEEVTPSGSVYYVREPNGALLARCTSATVVANYYHFDELGSTQFITNSSALVTDEYTYDPWGNVTSHTGSLNQPYQFVGKYGYYTHYNDNNVPYIQTGVRLYNSQLGRYMQRDRIQDDINGSDAKYSYVSDKPIKSKDPSGLETQEECWQRYNRCKARTLTVFLTCFKANYGISDIISWQTFASCGLGCIIGNIWNGEVATPACLAGCGIGMSICQIYTLVNTAINCIPETKNNIRICNKIKRKCENMQ